MNQFWGKILGPKFVKQIHHNNSAKILSKFCPHKFSPKLNPIWKKRVTNLKFSSFCPVNLNQHCTRMPLIDNSLVVIGWNNSLACADLTFSEWTKNKAVFQKLSDVLSRKFWVNENWSPFLQNSTFLCSSWFSIFLENVTNSLFWQLFDGFKRKKFLFTLTRHFTSRNCLIVIWTTYDLSWQLW